MVIFQRFMNFRPFFRPFLGIIVKNAKHIKVTPGIDINSQNPSVDIWVPKMRFPKMYIFGAPIESTVPGMVSS